MTTPAELLEDPFSRGRGSQIFQPGLNPDDPGGKSNPA